MLKCDFNKALRDDTHMTSMKTPCLSSSKIIPFLDLGCRISSEPPPRLQTITNQLKNNIIQG